MDIISATIRTRGDKYAAASQRFRWLMNANQSFDEPNNYRRSFYVRVNKRAAEIINDADAEMASRQGDDSRTRRNKGDPPGCGASEWIPGVGVACQKLAQKLQSLLGSQGEGPCIIVSFDEAGEISEPDRNYRDDRPLLQVLCDRISSLREVSSVFFLFLSTSPRIVEFVSVLNKQYQSANLTMRNSVNPVFTGCVFDALLPKNIEMEEGRISVQEAASEWCMMHFGRPMYVHSYCWVL